MVIIFEEVNNSVIVDQYNNVKEICTALGNVTIKNIVFDESFNTYAPTSLKDFFKNCKALETISGLKYLNTANVTDMSYMFYKCQKLSSLDLTNFNTKNVTNMSYMFSGCSALTSLDLTNFNTSKVESMHDMFEDCSALESLNLTNFNTENVTDMYGMFYQCEKLSSLDLSKFNTEKVTEMSHMFEGCSALTTIYARDKFIIDKYNNGYKMFNGCKLLKGALPGYEDNKTDNQYANYKTGYFTKLVGKNGDEKIGAVGETLTAESLALDDAKDFVAYEPFTATTATYNRTIGTIWATLCLPFEVSLENQNFRAFKLLSANEGTNTVELEEIKTNIEAGTPVIIKMSNGETKLNFSVANKEIAKEAQTSATADNNYQLQGIYTQKVFDKDADNNCYIVKGNMLMNPAKLLANTKVTKVASKPFRAYMVDNSSAPTAGAKMFSIAIGGSTTAIDSINTIADDNAIYYDLQGKRLNEPQKGINIVKRNGKTMKVIIK